jgi:hypothetical protein
MINILIYLFSWFFCKFKFPLLSCVLFCFILYLQLLSFLPYKWTRRHWIEHKVGLTFVSTSGRRIFTWMINLQVVTSACWTVWLKLFHYCVHGGLQFNEDSQTVGHKPLRCQQKASLLLSKKYYLYTLTYNIYC